MTISQITPPAVGSRVGFVCGPCESAADCAGTVLAHETTAWHTVAVVLMDDGTFRYPTQTTDVGIGCYQL